jgi:hypothetical protein
MFITKSNGTVVDLNVAQQAVDDMADPNVAREAIAAYLEAQGVCKIIFDNPASDQLIPIKLEGPEQGVTAATDFLLYNKYSHPATTRGLHIFQSADLNVVHAERVGYVHTTYCGDVIATPALVDGAHAWYEIGIRLGNIYCVPMRSGKNKVASMKHDYTDYLIQGYGLDVWVAPIRDWLSPFMVQWLMPDINDAIKYRNERLTASRLKRKELRPAGASAYKTLQSAVETGEEVVLPDEIMVINLDEETINLLDFTEPVGFRLYRGGSPVMTMSFDPNDAQSILTWANIMGPDSKYAVKQLS